VDLATVVSRVLVRRDRGWLIVPILLVAGAAVTIMAMLVLAPQSPAQAQSQAQLSLLQSDTHHVVLELTVPSYDTRQQSADGTVYTVISVPGLGYAGEPGQPQLPVKGTLIGLPPGAQPSLVVLSDDARREPLAYPPLPAPDLKVQLELTQTFPQNADLAIVPDSTIYRGARIFPLEAAKIVSVDSWRSQRVLSLQFHPVQYDPIARQVIWHRRLRIEVVLDDAGNSSGVSSDRTTPALPGTDALGAPVDEGLFEPILKQALLNYATARNWRIAAPASPSRLEAAAAEPWYKIGVNADGLYTITCAQLEGAGIDVSALDPRTLKIYQAGTELAIDVAGQADGRCDAGDFIEFYGQAARTKYTDTNIYWLTLGGAAGKRMASRDSSNAGSIPAAFTATLHLEQNKWYVTAVPMVEDADHWYWDYIIGPSAVNYGFSADQLASGNWTATLQVDLFGYTGGSHHHFFYLNDHLIADTTWSGAVERLAVIAFPQTFLDAVTNTLRISETVAGSVSYVNSFDLNYASGFTATNDVRRFRQASGGAWRYQIAGLSSPEAESFDISDPFSVTRIVSSTVTPVNSSYTLEFADTIVSPHEYLALASARRKSPVSIVYDNPSDLRSTNHGADYIIISYGGFITDVQPLANYRASQGLRVQVVDVQDVYDEFSYGLMDAQAIRDFLKYTYANWQKPAPAFVLLVGDGDYDFKNYLGNSPPNYIPPYLRLVDPWIGETATDNQYVAFGVPTTTLPYMAIGRLPANNAAEAGVMVAKILNYEQSPPTGAWRSRVTFVTDSAYKSNGGADTAGNFWELSDLIASSSLLLPTPMSADRIYYNPCPSSNNPQCVLPYTPYPTAASVRNGITTAINDGRLIVNYIGHGAVRFWAGDQIFRLQDLSALTNGPRLPVMLAMTCLEGAFHDPVLPSLAETNVRLAGGGALASWSASGFGVALGHDFLDQGFFAAVMQQGVYQIGPAAMLGKLNLWTNSGGAHRDLIDTFNLLGDPASRLAIAPDVAIAKTVSPAGPRLIGMPITYTLAFTNFGQFAADNVTINDLLPATLLTPTVVSSGVPITQTGSTLFEWTVGSLRPGAGGLITITARLDPVGVHWPTAWLTNTATITTTSALDNTDNDRSVTVTPIRFPIYFPVVFGR